MEINKLLEREMMEEQQEMFDSFVQRTKEINEEYQSQRDDDQEGFEQNLGSIQEVIEQAIGLEEVEEVDQKGQYKMFSGVKNVKVKKISILEQNSMGKQYIKQSNDQYDDNQQNVE